MMTKESFYECLSREEVAIKCENAEQWRHVYDTIVAENPHLANEDAFTYQSGYPWFCKWAGIVSGWTGTGTAHPRRYTYEEFMAIINQGMVPEDEIGEMGELL